MEYMRSCLRKEKKKILAEHQQFQQTLGESRQEDQGHPQLHIADVDWKPAWVT